MRGDMNRLMDMYRKVADEYDGKRIDGVPDGVNIVTYLAGALGVSGCTIRKPWIRDITSYRQAHTHSLLRNAAELMLNNYRNAIRSGATEVTNAQLVAGTGAEQFLDKKWLGTTYIIKQRGRPVKKSA
ncbi:MAG: hypothetical protein JW716_03975 [Candidatus Aenigmarchaeota archaeon]|nr:hypothetical protein [Candidatus Aenigmarchaeota archaeon]